ncbi:hypothetical protein [Haliscomenobacter hydrossis]|uniref:Uncharacterized protein n=1 Tax=Haliscomenobacter hydrossis (strain ATCC 27775 / DSM 1100 / LMG 10767 / O) TaxID=760192 RepID=F4KXE6_HALH1|nr:hypothetical protein [Haliscomenobacter hydrossis]AEE49354.1 hypothetical protein Halhy_1460 [Haliscomenobacter hydrossis DSM 1100]
MSTYDMILEEGIKIGERERQRLEEELEEVRQQVNKVILYLYQIDQKIPEEIALIVSKDLAYVETVISNSEEENIADN